LRRISAFITNGLGSGRPVPGWRPVNSRRRL
jgi:hypothetical protein